MAMIGKTNLMNLRYQRQITGAHSPTGGGPSRKTVEFRYSDA